MYKSSYGALYSDTTFNSKCFTLNNVPVLSFALILNLYVPSIVVLNVAVFCVLSMVVVPPSNKKVLKLDLPCNSPLEFKYSPCGNLLLGSNS